MSDDRLEKIISKLLRAGVACAAALVLAGGIWYVAASGGKLPDYRGFHPAARGLRALFQLPMPEALIEWGLVTLIATPVARVVFSLVAFAMERDWMYVLFTSAVLAVLLYSIGTAWL